MVLPHLDVQTAGQEMAVFLGQADAVGPADILKGLVDQLLISGDPRIDHFLSIKQIIVKILQMLLAAVPFLPGRIPMARSADTITGIFEKIYRGGMPPMITDPDLLPEDYFGAYMQTYLERDIRDLVAVKDENKFLKFISCAAARSGQEVNLADMAKDVEIDRKTADGWLSILVSSGIVYLLPPYSGNIIKRIVKRPKLYFMDTGLACYLSLWNNPRALELSAVASAMFENYVVSEIIKSYANQGISTRSRLCYYRDNNGKEIDLMILENGKIYPQ